MKGWILAILVSLLSLPVLAAGSGVLKVNEDIHYKKLFGRQKVITVGEYSAKVSLDNKHIKIKAKSGEGKHSIKLKFPKGQMPNGSGEFEISSTLTNQGFGASGSVDRQRQTGPQRSRVEYCTVQVPVRYCQRNPNDGRVYCRTVYESAQGRQRVIFHEEVTTENLVLRLKNQEAVLATYNGKNISRQIVTDHHGRCRYIR